MEVHKVPFYGTQREYQQHRNSIISIVDRVLSTGRMLQSSEVEQFEQNIADFVGRKYGIAVGSCTDALFFALKALGIHPGDEVLVTNFSFVASASAILRAGAKPVFVDIDNATMNMDLNDAESRISPRTKAIVWVHLYGLMGNVTDLVNFARHYNLYIVEDAAQALGARFGDRSAGSVGDISCFSFDPTKVISAPGSGGMVLTDDPDYAEKVRRYRYHGKGCSGTFDELGYNSQMPSITAAVLSYKLNFHDDWLKKRQEIADYYRECFLQLPLNLQTVPNNVVHAYHKFVIRTEKRNELQAFLKQNGIETNVHYALPLSAQPMFKNIAGQREDDYPVAFKCAATVLSLPIHPYLRDFEIEYVVEKIKEFFQKF